MATLAAPAAPISARPHRRRARRPHPDPAPAPRPLRRRAAAPPLPLLLLRSSCSAPTTGAATTSRASARRRRARCSSAAASTTPCPPTTGGCSSTATGSRSTSSRTPTATTGRASSPPSRPSAACTGTTSSTSPPRSGWACRRVGAHAHRARAADRPARRRPARALLRARARTGVDDPGLPRPRDAAREPGARRRAGARRSSTTRSRARCTRRPRPTTTRRPASTSPAAGSPAQPAEQFCFAQIGKPGKRRKTMSSAFVVTRRTHRADARDAGADRAGREPDRRALRALRARRAVGVRRPERLEVLAALLRAPRALSGRRRAVGGRARRCREGGSLDGQLRCGRSWRVSRVTRRGWQSRRSTLATPLRLVRCDSATIRARRYPGCLIGAPTRDARLVRSGLATGMRRARAEAGLL